MYKQSQGLKIKRKIYNILLRVIFTCDIPMEVKIGKNVLFPHNALGVVINQTSKIGDDSVIFPRVSLAGNGKIREDGSIINKGGPVLEDRVIVFTGACVLGPITIGHDSYVGANAVVTKDVPPNSIVVGHNIIKPRNFKYNL